MLKLLTFFTFILASTYASFPGNKSSYQNIEESPAKIFKRALIDAKNCSHDGAEFTIGTYYITGFGTKVNYQEGADWLKKAYENGDEQALLFLGMCNLAGLGIKQNLDEAEKLFKLAILSNILDILDNDDVPTKAVIYKALCNLLQKKENAQSAYLSWSLLNKDWTACYCMAKGYDAYLEEGGTKKRNYTVENFRTIPTTPKGYFHLNVINICFNKIL